METFVIALGVFHALLWLALISVIVGAIVSVVLHEIDRLIIMAKYGGIVLGLIALTMVMFFTLL